MDCNSSYAPRGGSALVEGAHAPQLGVFPGTLTCSLPQRGSTPVGQELGELVPLFPHPCTHARGAFPLHVGTPARSPRDSGGHSLPARVPRALGPWRRGSQRGLFPGGVC